MREASGARDTSGKTLPPILQPSSLSYGVDLPEEEHELCSTGPDGGEDERHGMRAEAGGSEGADAAPVQDGIAEGVPIEAARRGRKGRRKCRPPAQLRAPGNGENQRQASPFPKSVRNDDDLQTETH